MADLVKLGIRGAASQAAVSALMPTHFGELEHASRRVGGALWARHAESVRHVPLRGFGDGLDG
jgi:hypothetical protein